MELDKDALDRYITGNYGEDQFTDNIDFDMLRQQIEILAEMASEISNPTMPDDQREALEGVVNLLEHLLDWSEG